MAQDRNFQEVIDTFNRFLKENKGVDETLKEIYSNPYGKRDLCLEDMASLVSLLESPPYELGIEILWNAYREHDNARVRGTDPGADLVNVLPIVCYAKGDTDLLEPHATTMNKLFNKWIYDKQSTRGVFSPEQREWLAMIRDTMAGELRVSMDDQDGQIFEPLGGLKRAEELFGDELETLVEELRAELSP